MRSDEQLFTLENGCSPIRNPSTVAEDARLASLNSLHDIMKQVEDIMRQCSVRSMRTSKQIALFEFLDELEEFRSPLLDIDHSCAQRSIATARRAVLFVPEGDDHIQEAPHAVENSSF